MVAATVNVVATVASPAATAAAAATAAKASGKGGENIPYMYLASPTPQCVRY